MKQMCHGCRNQRHLVRRVSAFDVVIGGFSVADQAGIIWAKKEITNICELETMYCIIYAPNWHECVSSLLGTTSTRTMDHVCLDVLKMMQLFPSCVKEKLFLCFPACL